jgi:hypothetical protein
MRSQVIDKIIVSLASAVLLVFPLGASANLITNASFELGPGGVAVMASDWNIRSNTPDIFGPFAAWIDGVDGILDRY